MNERIKKIADKFEFKGKLVKITPVSIGLINDSYILEYIFEENTVRYLLQRINTFVFKKPKDVMSNIVSVTQYINDRNKSIGCFDPDASIFVIPSKNGENFYKSEDDEYYRAYNYIENTYTLDAVTGKEDAYNAGRAFGKFIYDLKDFDVDNLFVTIPDFHNTKKRYDNLYNAIKKDEFNRADSVKPEIDLIEKTKDDVFLITDLFEQGKIPCRVIHNDTKINNVLFDCNTHKTTCVVDLDTIMPGSFLHDFGDAITTGAVEDKDGKITLNLDYFSGYIRGYFESCYSILTKEEIELLPIAAKTLAFEVTIRFLADYLCADVYFKTEYDNHNLVRTRQQLTLVQDIISKLDDMKKITMDLSKEYSDE